jgi:hypothetical protein
MKTKFLLITALLYASTILTAQAQLLGPGPEAAKLNTLQHTHLSESGLA